MTIDERVRRAAAAARGSFDSIPLPDAGDVTRRVLRVRRARLGAAAVVLAAAVVVGVLTVPGDGRAPERVVAGGPEEEAVPPAGSLSERGWISIPKSAAGLDGVTAFTALSSDGPAMLLAGAHQVGNGWEPAIWRSEDGFKWVPSTVPGGGGELTALAADGETAVAIGTDGESNGMSTFVWRSDDGGRTWSVVASGSDLFGPAASEMGRPSASGLLRAKGYWIAYGGGSDGYEGIWVSRDGGEWEQVLASRSSGSVTVVETADGELLAYGVGAGPSADEAVTPTTRPCSTPPGGTCVTITTRARVVGWSTSDPTSWGEAEALSVPDRFHLGSVAPGAELAIGSNIDRHDVPTPLLRSDDNGRSWRADAAFLEQFPGAWAWTMSRAAGLWVAAGASGSPNHPDAWVSRDGAGWESLPVSLHGTPGGTLSLIGAAGDRVVLIGTAPELDRYYVYEPSYPPAVPSTATTTQTPVTGSRPTEMVAAIEAGVSLHRVVMVDVATGDVVRVLHDVDTGLPGAEAVAGTSSVAGVDLAPDGSSTLVDVCCEPAAGSTWEVLLDSGDAQRCCDLSEPAYAPDGERVAGITMQWPVVLEGDGKGRYGPVAGIDFAPRSGDEPLCAAAGAAWSPDGTRLAFVTADDCATGEWALRVLDLRTATSLADAAVFDPPAGRGYWAPAFRSDGRLVVVLQTPGGEVFEFTDSDGLVLDPATGEVDASFDYAGAVRSQSYDATGTWLLVTHVDGTVEWQGRGSSGTVPGTYIDADW